MGQFEFTLTISKDISEESFSKISQELTQIFEHKDLRVLSIEKKQGSTIFYILFDIASTKILLKSAGVAVSSACMFILKKIAGEEIKNFYNTYVRPKLISKGTKEIDMNKENFEEIVEITSEYLDEVNSNEISLDFGDFVEPVIKTIRNNLGTANSVELVIKGGDENCDFEFSAIEKIIDEKHKVQSCNLNISMSRITKR